VNNMNGSIDTPRPEINVFYVKHALPNGIVELVLLGIEEEGLLFKVEEKEKANNVISLAFDAAESSRLGVGVGITKDGIVLHQTKLEEKNPLFKIPITADDAIIRNLGMNAARLIKRMPFKEL